MREPAPISPAVAERRATPAADRRLLRWALTALAAMLAAVLLVGLVFAGSSERIAEGVHVGGVDVGGLTTGEAQALLERRAARLGSVPVVFTVGERTWEIPPKQLGVETDWRSGVKAALNHGEGVGPLRGFKRLQVRVFGVDIAPPTQVYDAALAYKLDQLAKDIDRPHREAALRRVGLNVVIEPGQAGTVLDREAAAPVIVRALASFARHPVALPVRSDPQRVTSADLVPVATKARLALSQPVRLTLGETRYLLPRWRIAEILKLPGGGATDLRIAGPGADRYFARLRAAIDRPPRDAQFAVSGETVTIVPDEPGRGVDVARTASSILAAATSATDRTAEIVVEETRAARTAADANAMGIHRLLSSYTTPYSGTADRIQNLQLAIAALDDTLLAPGETFSFNAIVGERTEERGYRTAPVIIAGEYEEDVGGGVSQVATTVFNAAWEAGLQITERNPHALYISRYQLGRDATVNYPNLDLKFVNDTKKWILVKGSSGSSGIAVTLYGGESRRVESIPGELEETGPGPVRRVPDPTLERGKIAVEEEGTNATRVSVERIVYAADGTELRRETWRTSYRGDYRIIRVGTKPPPEPEPEKKPQPDDAKKPPAAKEEAPAKTSADPAAPPPPEPDGARVPTP